MVLDTVKMLLALLFSLSLLESGYGILPHDPQQVHISTVSYDQMTIVWNTVNDTGDSWVVYGKGVNISLQTSGESHKFADGGSLHRVQYVHKVVLTGLAPKTKYAYKVGSKNYTFSDIFSFTTWPESDNWSPSLAIYGDLGLRNAQSLPRLEADTYQGLYDSILHVGDFAYNLASYDGKLGDQFMRLIEPLTTSLPYMTCPGNHEAAYNFSNYRNRFEMPGDENKRMYYSYTMGPIRFISVSTEFFYFPQYGTQPIIDHYYWLEQELKNANKPENRAKQPWVITFGHRPMYCSNTDHDDCTKHESLVRVGIPYGIYHFLGWEKLFYENGVDLALWAHEHSYERLWPVYNREVKNGSYQHPYTNPPAPVHIITGSAGCQEDVEHFVNVTEAWSAFRSSDYGYARMKVYNSTHLSMEQVSDDKGGVVIDKFMLIKDKHGSYPWDPTPVKPVSDPLRKLGEKWHNDFKKSMLSSNYVIQ